MHHLDRILINRQSTDCWSDCPLCPSALLLELQMECYNNPMVFWFAASVGRRSHTPEEGRHAVVLEP